MAAPQYLLPCHSYINGIPLYTLLSTRSHNFTHSCSLQTKCIQIVKTINNKNKSFKVQYFYVFIKF
ncbi:hypothetical protein HanIR_Chr13g0644171 [Helianthus annuus]|nr:hypothetical protein HanIR_Chr13g0644171 [Helianthus annuus]